MYACTFHMTIEEKLDVARKMIYEVWEAIVPDYAIEDTYHDQVEFTANRLIDDIQEMQRFVDDSDSTGSPEWNPDFS